MEDNQITDNDKEDDKQDRIELVQRAVEGDKEAFTNLYMLTYSEVYHIVKVFIHNEDTAQDIVQETYYKSLRKIKQLKEPDKFPVWIKKIAVNTAKAHLRKVDWVLFSEADGEGGKSIAELQDERLEHIPEIVVDQAETKELIDQILGELDEKQRMADVGQRDRRSFKLQRKYCKEPSELCEKKDRKRDRRTGEKGSYPADSCTGSDSHVSVSETSGSSGTDTEGEVPGESGDRKSDCHRNCSSSDLYGNRTRCCENSGQAPAGAGDTGAAGGYR